MTNNDFTVAFNSTGDKEVHNMQIIFRLNADWRTRAWCFGFVWRKMFYVIGLGLYPNCIYSEIKALKSAVISECISFNSVSKMSYFIMKLCQCHFKYSAAVSDCIHQTCGFLNKIDIIRCIAFTCLIFPVLMNCEKEILKQHILVYLNFD